MRIPALDSIRGLLLLQMTLDHFGRPISKYLYQCFGFFSAAEGFFFLSGFVGFLAAKSKFAKDPCESWMRARALKTWQYHMRTLLFLAVLGYFLVSGIYPYYKTLYQHPLDGLLWSALLIHTPSWLDVLPLYVIFLFIASYVMPVFVKAKNKTRIVLVWLISFFIWFIAQFNIRGSINAIFPSWIYHGFFDPFAWQFVYFSGAAVVAWYQKAKENNSCALNIINKITPFILLPLLFCFLWSHAFIPLGAPSEFFISREHLGILRFANFFLFMLVICAIVRKSPSLLDFKFASTLGRASLDVYTAHIIIIYLWFSAPGVIRYHSPWNILCPIITCIVLWAIAKWRTSQFKK